MLTFCLENLSIDVSRALNPPTIIVLLSVSIMSVNHCFIYFDIPGLGAYILITILFPCWIDPFISIQYPFWSLVTIYGFKSVLSIMSIFFWLKYSYSIFFHLFTFFFVFRAESSGESTWLVQSNQSLSIFWLVKSVNLHLGHLLIDESLVLPFYLCFFVCFTFPLFLFPCVGDFVWCFSHFPLFYVLCLCSRFMFCGYHEDFVKCLINEMVFSLLMSFYLHLPIILSFSSSPFRFFVVTNHPFLCCEFMSNLK